MCGKWPSPSGVARAGAIWNERIETLQCVGRASAENATNTSKQHASKCYSLWEAPRNITVCGKAPIWGGARRRTLHRPDGCFAPSIHHHLDAPRRRVILDTLDSVVYTPGRAGHPVTSASPSAIVSGHPGQTLSHFRESNYFGKLQPLT